MIRQAISRLLRRTGFALLRATSEYRAVTDLFVSPYSDRVDWHSGLGDMLFFLYGLVRAKRPQIIVEIGSARGRSTCALALACRQNDYGHVFAIDPHDVNPWTEIGTGGQTEQFLRSRLRDYRLDEWCDVIVQTSREAARGWSRRIDLLFIDGDHSFEGVQSDFELFQPWLAPDSLVLFHDTAWNYHETRLNEPQPGDLREKLEAMGVPRFMELLKQKGYRSVTFAQIPGLTVLDPLPGGFVFCPPTPESAVLETH